jgi:hypothetical protein
MSAENEETVMDVINDALGVSESTESTEHEEPSEPEETTEEAGTEHEGAEEEGAEEEGAEEGAGAGEGRQRGPDGKFLPKADKTVEGKDGKPGEKPGQPAKEPDPLNDPIPKDLKQETQQRIRTLIDRTKDAETRASKFETDFNYMVQGVQATGASPDQYGEVLSWLALFNSGDPSQQGKALELLESVADRLATMIGRERTTSDPLANHPDLVAAVQKREITEKYAKDLARSRNQGAFRNELATSHSQTQAAQQEATRVRNQARSDLNALETRLSQSDPQYAQKKAQLVPILQVTFANMSPDKWPAAFEAAYKKLRLPGAAAPAARTGTVPKNQPMRGGKGVASGGGGTGMNDGGPKTMLDAVNGALSRMGR